MLIVIGAIVSAVAGYLILNRGSSDSSPSGATGGGSPPTMYDYSTTPTYNIEMPENPFPAFDFSLPDPNDYTTSSNATKKASKSSSSQIPYGVPITERSFTPEAKKTVLQNPYATPETKMKVLFQPTLWLDSMNTKKGG